MTRFDKATHAETAAHIASAVHVAHCFETLAAHFAGQPAPPASFADSDCPLFVTWNKCSRSNIGTFGLRARRSGYHLRGCIGTLSPRRLHTALSEYALTAALHDRRFPPITLLELPLLKCTVSLLHGFETAASWQDWQVGVHGLIINYADPLTGIARTATFLPEVAAGEGWDVVQTIDALIRKAGYDGVLYAALRNSLQVTRYQSTAHSLSYEEYAAAATGVEPAAEPLERGSALVGAVPA